MKNLKQLLREPQEFYFTERMTAEGANALYTSLLQDGADAIEKLEAENTRLTECLRIANSNHEEFERKWYLATEEIAQRLLR